MTPPHVFSGQAAFELGMGEQDELSQEDGDDIATVTTTAREEARQSIDDLVREAVRYRRSAEYLDLLRFATAFRDYSPYNALLADIQHPGAQFLATARRWRE